MADGGQPRFRISSAELQQMGAEWHEQGARSSDMAANMASPLAGGESVTAAALMSVSSSIESLIGNLFVATSALCERLEALYAVEKGRNAFLQDLCAEASKTRWGQV